MPLSTIESYCMCSHFGWLNQWKVYSILIYLNTHSHPFPLSQWCWFLRNFRLPVLVILKVSQRLTEYGVHFHRVLPEKRSQTGIMLGVYSKGVLIFEVLNGNRTPVLRFPWRETKKISFTVCISLYIIRNKTMPLYCKCSLFTKISLLDSTLMFNSLSWRKRRFAFRTRRMGLSTCFRQTATRRVSICYSSALTSTSSTCRWRRAKTTRSCRT